MRIHRATIIGMTVVGLLLLWLNMRTPEWAKAYNTNSPPEDVDPLTRLLFFRGWPFTPCGYCVLSGKWHTDRYAQMAAMADVAVFLLAVVTTGMICEWFWHRRGKARRP